MSDTKPTEGTNSKSPTHIAYQVRDRDGKKGFWTRIGTHGHTPTARDLTSSSTVCRSTAG